MTATIVRLATAEDHPKADRLSVYAFADAAGAARQAISNKVEGRPRYAAGDLVVFLAAGSVLPEWLLRRLDAWDEAAGRGRLGGDAGDTMAKAKLRGVETEGMLMPVRAGGLVEAEAGWTAVAPPDGGDLAGVDVSDLLGLRSAAGPAA